MKSSTACQRYVNMKSYYVKDFLFINSNESTEELDKAEIRNFAFTE